MATAPEQTETALTTTATAEPAAPAPRPSSALASPMGFEPTNMRQLWWLCEQLVGTGFLPSRVTSPGQAVAIILAGKELGLGTMQALRGVHIIEGKISLAADTQLGLMIRAGIRFKWLDKTDKRACLRLERPNQEPEEFAFTIEEADRAGLVRANRDGKPGNWQKYPAAMLRARVVSMAGRAYAPDVLTGIYVPGELGEASSSPEMEFEPPPSGPEAKALPAPKPVVHRCLRSGRDVGPNDLTAESKCPDCGVECDRNFRCEPLPPQKPAPTRDDDPPHVEVVDEEAAKRLESIATVKEAIGQAATVAQLIEVGQGIAEMELAAPEREAMREIYAKRKAELIATLEVAQ
jgi:hypothetical protein